MTEAATHTSPRLIGFDSPFPVAVSQTGPREWELTSGLVYTGRRQRFYVPVGSTTDFASVPAVLTWLVPITTGIAAAVLHDHLWRSEIPAGRISYRDADGILRQALGTLGVPLLRCWLMWAGVRWGALTRPGGRSGWWRDAPAVLGITVLALPFAAASAVLVPFIALFKLVEWVIG